jgi:ferredoxin
LIVVTRLRIELNTDRCRSFAKCTTTAPAVFALDVGRKVVVIDPFGNDDDTIVKAAKSCPYKVITLIDEATGVPVYPPRRKLHP